MKMLLDGMGRRFNAPFSVVEGGGTASRETLASHMYNRTGRADIIPELKI